jgi:signal transduction histidine kinase
VKKMDSVISDIMQLARSAKSDLNLEQIDFNKLLNETIADVKFNKGAKAISLRYSPDPSYVFLTDHSQIKIILGNLIANAVKYHFVEQPEPFIAVRFMQSNDTTLIEVEDNGTGIAKEYQEKIFHMFFRATTQSEGTGLGLYIVAEAVTKLNGKISVQSEVGKGSIFSVKLPNN